MAASPTQAKKLIEVAMPVKEVSAESVRDKSIRHGHISTLHLWWARRPLPVCRAVVFASLVPDPLGLHCPPAFVDAVKDLLKGPQYKPYDDIPFTPAIDPLEDNARNRLLMFIGKFSDEFVRAERQGKKVASKDQLSGHSLIKWESKNDERILNIARKLIWVSHNAEASPSGGKGEEKDAQTLMVEFDRHYQAIKTAEKELYGMPDRHLATADVQERERQLQQAIDAFLDKMPRVFDPFAGGGAIPLEAARLGCRSYGNDINPVAHIIQKGSLEFPQKYGKPITYSAGEFVRLYRKEELERQRQAGNVFGDKVQIANRLAFDVEYYARKLLDKTEKEVGHLYPTDEEGNKPIAYYWARVGRCSNPACGIKIPLIKQLYLARKGEKKVYLNPIIDNNGEISFEVKKGETDQEGWVQSRKNLLCPVCNNVTANAELKHQFLSKKIEERLIAVVEESSNGKAYRLPTNRELEILNEVPEVLDVPNEKLPADNKKQFDVVPWGFETFGSLFSNRQLITVGTIVNQLYKLKKDFLHFEAEQLEYSKAVSVYLSILLNRIAISNTSFGIWHTGRETLERIMGRQAIAMVFDYPESNPFCNSTGSINNQIDWITRYIESESDSFNWSICHNASSGEKNQFSEKSLSAVITDPPYYDAIAYADLADFFYVWLKRSLGDLFPINFAFPQTPKSDECTALKYHHNGSIEKAKKHFENKLAEIFRAIEKQTQGIISIMFAHQSTEAWTTLCDSILGANMNISASWANDTEMTGALKTDKAFLSSSVTVACRPSEKSGYGDYKEVRQAIEKTIRREVKELYAYGFRGADLLTACFGQAVSEFGKYKRVEKANGEEVAVAELLEMAREAAFNAIVSDIETDDYTRFYIGWLQLFGFEQAEHDTVRKVTQIGLNTNIGALQQNNILVTEGNKQSLATFAARIAADKKLGLNKRSFAIDQAHRAMHLYMAGNRGQLLSYLAEVAPSQDSSLWRILNSLAEVLPNGMDDYKQAHGLLTNKDSLIREAVAAQKEKPQQMGLFDEE